MRRLNKNGLMLFMGLWFILITLVNTMLVYACIKGYYEGIYVLGVVMFITMLNGATLIVKYDLKEWRF